MVPHARFLAARTRKKKKMLRLVLVRMLRLVLVRGRTAVKISLRYSTGKIKSNPPEPHFQTSATMSRCLEHTKTAVALPHCSESTEESIAGWCIFGSKVWLKLLQSDGMSYKKNTQVEMLPVVDLCKKSAKRHSFGRR